MAVVAFASCGYWQALLMERQRAPTPFGLILMLDVLEHMTPWQRWTGSATTALLAAARRRRGGWQGARRAAPAGAG